MTFAQSIIKWDKAQSPRYPWMHEKDGYRILVSEYLLQQTRSTQALPYYNKIIERFPTVKDLAESDPDELLLLWQGLGYYRRARLLHQAAQAIHELHGGVLPSTEEELRDLPGIGLYTAAAVASFAYGASAVVVDGNVYRVLSRYHADSHPRDISSSWSHYAKRARRLLGKQPSAPFNQAIMNLGASVCTPKRPKCGDCPVKGRCKAYKKQRQLDFPVRAKTVKKRARYLHFIHYDLGEDLLIQKRTEKDVWQGLFAMPALDQTSSSPLTVSTLNKALSALNWPQITAIISYDAAVQQTLTHQKITSRFYRVTSASTEDLPPKWKLVSYDDLSSYAMPKTILDYLHTFVL